MKKLMKWNIVQYTYRGKSFSIEYNNEDIVVQQNFGAYVEIYNKDYWAKYDTKNNSALFIQDGKIKENHLMSDIYDPTDDIDFIDAMNDIVDYMCDHLIELNANVDGRVVHY